MAVAPIRVLLYDIETTDLDLDFGHILAFGYQWLGERTHVLSMLDTNRQCPQCRHVDATDDAALMRHVIPLLSAADMWVTWYGKRFDERGLNTRIMDARLPPLPDVPHVDLYWVARNRFKLSSNRLASVQDFLRLPTTKTPLTKRVWRRAQAGDVRSIRYVVEHCRRDVDVLQQAYMLLRPYVRVHPRLAGRGACRVCGAATLERKELRVTTTLGSRVRYRCQSCGHSETRAPERMLA